jgi:hypothetical protein
MSTVNGAVFLILRWSETCDPTFHEHSVELISSYREKTVLRSPVSLQEHTAVLLPENEAGGIVQSCYQEGGAFILTISSKDEINMSSSEPQRDPGALAVDDFLSEDQEAELLKHWND